MLSKVFKGVKWQSCLWVLLGSAILSFGLFEIHSRSGVTEGGGLGMTLLLDHWFQISPAISGFIFNMVCYVAGWRVMGRQFIVYSVISSIGFSLFYSFWGIFPPLWPQIGNNPLLAALLGAAFVGIGCGICVRAGGAPGGDDAMAMSISKTLKVNIQWVYLCSDLVVLVLSASYIPLPRLVFSLLTVILSGQLIGIIQTMKVPLWLSGKVAEVD